MVVQSDWVVHHVLAVSANCIEKCSGRHGAILIRLIRCGEQKVLVKMLLLLFELTLGSHSCLIRLVDAFNWRDVFNTCCNAAISFILLTRLFVHNAAFRRTF
jgi:hypothetical protein